MEQAPNNWEGILRATIRVLPIAGKYDELLKALKLKAQLEQSDNAEGMYEKALLSLECKWTTVFNIRSLRLGLSSVLLK